MKKTMAALLIMALASCAVAADPTLVYTSAPTGTAGLTGYTFSCTADVDSFFVLTDIVFTADPGTTFSLHLNGMIKDETTVAGTGGDLNLVSFYYDEFSPVAPNNVVFASNGITLNSIAMPGGVVSTDIPALHIVADGNFSWSGILTYANASTGGKGVDVLVSGQVPEPATMALLGLGGLGLIRRRRA